MIDEDLFELHEFLNKHQFTIQLIKYTDGSMPPDSAGVFKCVCGKLIWRRSGKDEELSRAWLHYSAKQYATMYITHSAKYIDKAVKEHFEFMDVLK